MTIGFDFDGVIFDMGPIIAHELSKLLGRIITIQELTEHSIENCFNLTKEQTDYVVNCCYRDEYFWGDRFVPGARGGLKRMHSLNYPINIITARPHPERVRNYILSQIDIEPSLINVYYTRSKDKGQMAHDLGLTAFVDDHFVSLDSIAQYGIFPILFDNPWNQNPPAIYYHRIKSWGEIEEMILEL